MISNQFQFRGSVDDHNKNIMEGDDSHGMSLETTWRNITWVNKVFGFILAMIEVDIYLAMRYFGPMRKYFGYLQKNLAFEIVFDKYMVALQLLGASCLYITYV